MSLGVCVCTCVHECLCLCMLARYVYATYMLVYTCMYVGYCYTIFMMQMLVRTYQWTGIPGEFDWKPGILCRVDVNDTIVYCL